MPAGGSFQGVWFSTQYGEMQLVQNELDVVGEYEKNDRRGRIEGRVTGDVLRFRWTERRELVEGRPTITSGRGYFRYEIGQDAKHYLVGEWGHDMHETGGGPWRAYKLSKQRPQLSSEPPSSPDAAGGEEEGSSPQGSDDLEGLDQ